MRFDLKAERYQEHATVQAAVSDWCAEWIEADVSQLRAVEFGAGTGLFTRRLATAGFRSVLASDISARMAEEGSRRVSGVEWRRIDAWQPQLDGSFDRVYAASLLQWAEEPVGTLRRWRELLEEGGRALVCIFVAGTMREALAVDSEIAALQWRSPGEWEKAFEDSGFRIERSETRLDVRWHGDALDAFRSLHATGAVREHRYAIGRLRGVLSEMNRRYASAEGLPMSWRTLRLEAVVE